MGRYNNGTKECDQSYYNTFWSTPPFIKRDLASDRQCIEDARANMSIASHIWATILSLQGKIHLFEKSVKIL